MKQGDGINYDNLLCSPNGDPNWKTGLFIH